MVFARRYVALSRFSRLMNSAELLLLLPDHRFPPQGIFALYPNTRHVPEKVRRFIDFLKKQMAESPAQSKI
ncbi:hypothetical protein FS594_25035 (plasmid) [Rahnella aquatilis]|nr:hypothetical protein FS594_25035 [Rahnella aquatilis]